MTAAAWLLARASSYGTDARLLEATVRRGESADAIGGLTGEQWAAVYRAVAKELQKCAAEVMA